MRRIDYRSGLRFAAAGIPGSILGALAVQLVPRHLFDAIMATVLTILAVAVVRLRPHAERRVPRGASAARELVDAGGEVYRYRVPLGRGTAYSAGVGFLSSFLGIGGGVIHVPLMAGALGFPTHIATATSHFILVWMSGTAASRGASAGRRSGSSSAWPCWGLPCAC